MTQAPGPPSVLLTRLKAQTRAEHDAIEGALALTDTALTLGTYRHRIAQFYGFYRPLEARWAASSAGEPSIDFAPRRKTLLLEADLRALGLDATTLPLCSRLPALATPAERLGCLYVLEGSTLGGQVIARHLLRTLGIGPDDGARYFHGYGERTAALWHELRAALSAFADRSPDAHDAVVASAIATFRSLRHWCQGARA